MNTNNIGVIGIGKLGLSFALLAEHCGYDVFGCDTCSQYVESLYDGTFRSTEPFIEDYLKSATKFAASTDTQIVVQDCNILFCFVATPSLPDGSYDHSAIDRVVADLQELHVRGMDMSSKVLVIGCTTMPGYCDTVQERLESTGISVVYNPEFIAQGSIIQGLRFADMVLIGTDNPTASDVLAKLYDRIMDITPRFNIMSRKAAELTKISINCYLTMKIGYANMIGEIAINSGCETEVNTILTAIGDDSRIGHKCLRYGFGYGGPCLPRDMKALGVHAGRTGTQAVIPKAIDVTNNLHANYLFRDCIANNTDNLPFLFTQLTYKPGTDMLVESQQYRLCKDLLEAGYSVDITESPAVLAQVQLELAMYEERVTYGQVTNGYKIEL